MNSCYDLIIGINKFHLASDDNNFIVYKYWYTYISIVL